MERTNEPPLLNANGELSDEWVTWFKNRYPNAREEDVVGNIGVRLLILRANIDVQLETIWKNNDKQVMDFLKGVPELIEDMVEYYVPKPTFFEKIITFFRRMVRD